MLDETDANRLTEAYWLVNKALLRIESITTDDDVLGDTYEQLENASFELFKMLEAYEQEQTKDWDTPIGDY